MNEEPAFPAKHFDLADGEHGLTMRDYFAAQAMQMPFATSGSRIAIAVVPDQSGDYRCMYHPAKPGARGAFPVTVIEEL